MYDLCSCHLDFHPKGSTIKNSFINIMGFKKSVTVYLVRHGETVGNDTKLVMHPDEDILNVNGKIQATNLGINLKQVDFSQVYTSNYPRTIETASIILSQNLKNKDPPQKIDDRLREIGIEQLYGESYGLILKALMTFLKSGRPLDEFSVEGSEPIPSVRERSKEFLMDLIQDISSCSFDDDSKLLIVSHGAFVRLFMEHFILDKTKFNTTGWDQTALNITRNTGCNIFKIQIPDHESKEEQDQRIHIKFEKIHDFSHLTKEMLANDSLVRLIATPEGSCLSGCFQV